MKLFWYTLFFIYVSNFAFNLVAAPFVTILVIFFNLEPYWVPVALWLILLYCVLSWKHMIEFFKDKELF